MRLWLTAAALVTLTIAACGRPGGTGVVPVSPPDQALVAWSGFPANQIPRPIVLIGNFSPSSGFSSNEAKIAAMCHKFMSGTTLSSVVPAHAQAMWKSGTTAGFRAISAAAALAAMMHTAPPMSDPSCATVPPLVVNSARYGIYEFLTDRGNAQISAWLFTVSGAIGEMAYPALAASALWNGGLSNGPFNRGSTVSADGRSLTFSFWGAPSSSGPCGADYKGVIAESNAAVAVAVQMIPHESSGGPVVCPAFAQERSVIVTLARPLGGRVVVDASSAAVSVCPAALTRSC